MHEHLYDYSSSTLENIIAVELIIPNIVRARIIKFYNFMILSSIQNYVREFFDFLSILLQIDLSDQH